MIDMRIRPRVTGFLDWLGRGLVALGMTPTATTLFGLAVVLAGSVAIATGRLVLGAGMVAIGSLVDGLDGAVARMSNRVTARGAYLDAASDRVGEITAFAGLGFAMAGFPTILLLIVLAIGGALLVPYMRARAEAEGLDGRGGLMGRGERLIVFCTGLILFPDYVEAMLWIFVVLVWLTAFTRFWKSYRSIR